MLGGLVGSLIDVKADGVAVTFHGQVLLAVAAQAILVGQAVRVKDAANLVRRVAVDASRNLAWIFAPQTALDDLAMYVFNLPMTRGTGLANVARMDTRPLVGVWEYVVRSVTRGTDRCDSEALRKQAFTVDTHRVVLEDIVLRNLVSP